jgi:hypothetical protein
MTLIQTNNSHKRRTPWAKALNTTLCSLAKSLSIGRAIQGRLLVINLMSQHCSCKRDPGIIIADWLLSQQWPVPWITRDRHRFRALENGPIPQSLYKSGGRARLRGRHASLQNMSPYKSHRRESGVVRTPSAKEWRCSLHLFQRSSIH